MKFRHRGYQIELPIAIDGRIRDNSWSQLTWANATARIVDPT
jgi:hypothetical protein